MNCSKYTSPKLFVLFSFYSFGICFAPRSPEKLDESRPRTPLGEISTNLRAAENPNKQQLPIRKMLTALDFSEKIRRNIIATRRLFQLYCLIRDFRAQRGCLEIDADLTKKIISIDFEGLSDSDFEQQIKTITSWKQKREKHALEVQDEELFDHLEDLLDYSLDLKSSIAQMQEEYPLHSFAELEAELSTLTQELTTFLDELEE